MGGQPGNIQGEPWKQAPVSSSALGTWACAGQQTPDLSENNFLDDGSSLALDPGLPGWTGCAPGVVRRGNSVSVYTHQEIPVLWEETGRGLGFPD